MHKGRFTTSIALPPRQSRLFFIPVLWYFLSMAILPTAQSQVPAPVWEKVYSVDTRTNHPAYGKDIAISDDGDVLFSFLYITEAHFLDQSVGGQNVAFYGGVAKVSPEGSLRWMTATEQSVTPNCIVAGPENDVYFAGSIGGANAYLYVQKLSPEGKVVWTRTPDFGSKAVAHDLARDSEGNIYVVGYFEGSLTVENTTVFSTNRFSFGAFVLSYRADGAFRWLKGNGKAYNAPTAVAVSEGHLYWSGVNDDEFTCFLEKRDVQNGSILWRKVFSGTRITALAVNDEEEIFLSSYSGEPLQTYQLRKYTSSGLLSISTNTARFGVNDISVGSDQRLYFAAEWSSIAKVICADTAFNILWELSSTGGDHSTGAYTESVALSADRIWLAGWYSGSPQFGAYALNAGPGHDGFLASVAFPSIPPPSITTHPQSLAVRAGERATFTVTTKNGGPFTYTWLKDGIEVPNSASASLVISNVTSLDEGTYTVRVSKEGTAVTSLGAKLTLIPSPELIVSTLAGTGEPGYQDSSDPLQARLFSPNGIAYAHNGNIIFSDGWNHAIRSLAPNGTVATLAGTNLSGFSDGPGSSALFSYPLGMQIGPTGDIFVADYGNNRIRRITAAGMHYTITLAGSGEAGYENGSVAKFSAPNDLIQDSTGNIYVSEFLNHSIRRISPSGVVSTIAGSNVPGFSDGLGSEARFNQIGGITSDGADLYVTDWGNHRIRRISVIPDTKPAQWQVSTVAGSGIPGLKDGFPEQAQFNTPDGISADSAGNLYVTEHGNSAIRMIRASDRLVITLAGGPSPGWVDGDQTRALFNRPGGIAVMPDGNLLIADTENHRLRHVNLSPGQPQTGSAISVNLQPSLLVRGQKGRSYQIEYTDHPGALMWTPIEIINLRYDTLSWTDPRPAKELKRLYRAVLLP
jgi:serine/threonine-protein kinase